MSFDLDIDEIRANVTLKFNQTIPPNDPILMTVILSDIVLKQALNRLQEHQNLLVHEIIVARNKLITEEKETAGRIITESAAYVRKQISEAADDSIGKFENQKEQISKVIVKNIKDEIDRHFTIFLRRFYTFIGLICLFISFIIAAPNFF